MFAEFGLTLLPYRVLVIIIPVGKHVIKNKCSNRSIEV